MRSLTHLKHPTFVRWFGSDVTLFRAAICIICTVVNGVLLFVPGNVSTYSNWEWLAALIVVPLSILMFGTISVLCLYLAAWFLSIFVTSAATSIYIARHRTASAKVRELPEPLASFTQEWAINGLLLLGELGVIYGKVVGFWLK
jgi:hypothetical protein